MRPFLLDLLICPECHGELDWHIAARDAEQIEEADAVCRSCGCSYPVREGIGVFLTPDLQRKDLWKEAESGLGRHLREHPEVEQQLLGGPLTTLNAADRFFRGYVLEERGRRAEAEEAFDAARPELYTPETASCMDSTAAALVTSLPVSDGPIVDIASGRGFLVERLARGLDRPIVATDFSVTALRRARRRFVTLGLDGRGSFLAIDARRTPFRDGSLPTLTTYVGLQNIDGVESALRELNRVTSGTLYAISTFYGDGDPNTERIRGIGATFCLRSEALTLLADTGWEATIAQSCSARALPTPVSEILRGATIDTLPSVETTTEWVLLELRPVR